MASIGAMGCANRRQEPAAPTAKYVRFDAGNAIPKGDEDMMEIGTAYQALSSDAKLQAGVIGHASSEGDSKRNRELSLRRAENVRDTLVKKGIATPRLTVAARGSDQPAVPNDTEEGRAKNRRVEVYFYYPERGDLQAQYGVKLEFKAQATIK